VACKFTRQNSAWHDLGQVAATQTTMPRLGHTMTHGTITARDVEVRLAGALARFSNEDGNIRVASGRSVLEAAAEIGIPRQQPLAAVVNGQTVDLSTILAPGDCLTLLPPIAGG
jgi:molybdopterin converting factor small subunit